MLPSCEKPPAVVKYSPRYEASVWNQFWRLPLVSLNNDAAVGSGWFRSGWAPVSVCVCVCFQSEPVPLLGTIALQPTGVPQEQLLFLSPLRKPWMNLSVCTFHTLRARCGSAKPKRSVRCEAAAPHPTTEVTRNAKMFQKTSDYWVLSFFITSFSEHSCVQNDIINQISHCFQKIDEQAVKNIILNIFSQLFFAIKTLDFVMLI